MQIHLYTFITILKDITEESGYNHNLGKVQHSTLQYQQSNNTGLQSNFTLEVARKSNLYRF